VLKTPATKCLFVAISLALRALIAPAAAQRVVPLVMIGSETEERTRLAQLADSTLRDGVLLRSVSRAAYLWSDSAWHVALVAPEARLVRNSALFNSPNDAGLRAGRGANTIITAGLDIRVGRVRLILAPQFIAEENRPFQVIPYPQRDSTSRSVWANPFHPLPESIDLPLRFGDEAKARLDAGQSSLTISAGPLDFGAASENLWWGPGIRNAIVLSNNAPGIPHLFVRPNAPLATSVGDFDFDVIAGQLHDSPFFERVPQTRSLAGVALTWRPMFERGLQFGFTRLRMDGNTGHGQMSSLFGRWVFPTAGFEAYFEWARFEDPASLRDFLEYPTHSQGYTFGLQWARPAFSGSTFRFQAEATYLEPDASLRLRPVRTTYTSSAVPQGFTEQGQVLGAAIGPGSSSQWIAGDFFGAPWRVGAFAGRIRTDNGVLFEPIVPEVKRADVTLLTGLRASSSWHGVRALVEFTNQVRLNYLFQAYLDNPDTGETHGIDIDNRTLSLTLSTAVKN
jgi:hypothetical protein